MVKRAAAQVAAARTNSCIEYDTEKA